MIMCRYINRLIFCFLFCMAVTQQVNLLAGEIIKPRMRVIIINDFGGDPDGLFQLVHHVLSPSVEIRGIIGSHIQNAGFFDVPKSALYACEKANEVMKVMELENKYIIYKGADTSLKNMHSPQLSEGIDCIIKEALREDTNLPLYVVCGCGLTEIASAYLLKPDISKKLTLVWIGGPEYPEMAYPPPGNNNIEYNLSIDIQAARIIFNQSDIPVWQIPRDVYRQAIVSYAELLKKVKPCGKTGDYLVSAIENVMRMTSVGETYILGDNPLVLFTSLQSSFDADPSSSRYIIKSAPVINSEGNYESYQSKHKIRIYTDIDIRLMMEDFYQKVSSY